MALMTRLSRLIAADLHAVLDRIEEPEVLLKQAVREMQEEVTGNEQRLKWLRAEAQQLEKKRRAGAAALEELDCQLNLCFEIQEMQLARSLVRRKLIETQRDKALVARVDSVADAIAELDALLADQRAKLDEMQQGVELLVNEAPVGVGGFTEFTVTEDEVEIALLREKQQRSRS